MRRSANPFRALSQIRPGWTVTDGEDFVAVDAATRVPHTWPTRTEAEEARRSLTWHPRRHAGPFRVEPVDIEVSKYGTVLAVRRKRANPRKRNPSAEFRAFVLAHRAGRMAEARRLAATLRSPMEKLEAASLLPLRRNIGGTGGLGQGGYFASDTVGALRGSTRGTSLDSSGYRVGGSSAEEVWAAREQERAVARMRQRMNPKKRRKRRARST